MKENIQFMINSSVILLNTNIGCIQDIPTNTVNPFEDDLTGMFYRKQ